MLEVLSWRDHAMFVMLLNVVSCSSYYHVVSIRVYTLFLLTCGILFGTCYFVLPMMLLVTGRHVVNAFTII